MAQDPEKKLQHELNRLDQYRDDDTLPKETVNALIEWAHALHPDSEEFEYRNSGGESPDFAVGTVETYLREMRKFAERACPELLTVSPQEFNDEIDAMRKGGNDDVKDGGLAKTTLAITQSAGRAFYEYFDSGDPTEVIVYGESSNPKHDEDDLFTQDDIRALRESVEGKRNRAILEMLLNTGQRISAIQGLRIKDINLETGCFLLNTNREGLKKAERRGRRRPLFGAQEKVAHWIEVHPFSDDPDSFLFIGDPDHHKTKPDQPLCQGTIRNMLRLAAERSGVEKPVNPHNFRHYWTTIMKRNYGLNDEEIKYLMGHVRSGNGINSVYNHTTESYLDENIDKKRNESEGISKPLTPQECIECSGTLRSHWKFCPLCGTQYGP